MNAWDSWHECMRSHESLPSIQQVLYILQIQWSRWQRTSDNHSASALCKSVCHQECMSSRVYVIKSVCHQECMSSQTTNSTIRLIQMWHDSFKFDWTYSNVIWLIYMWHSPSKSTALIAFIIVMYVWIHIWRDPFTRDMTFSYMSWPIHIYDIVEFVWSLSSWYFDDKVRDNYRNDFESKRSKGTVTCQCTVHPPAQRVL